MSKAPLPYKKDLSSSFFQISIGLLHVVCPLLFFTNLTRNPYFTQISLLNILIGIAIVVWAVSNWKKECLHIPKFPFDIPLLAFLMVAFLSSLVAYFQYTFVRPGVLSESVRVWVFTLVNSVFVIYLPGIYKSTAAKDDKEVSIWVDLSGALFWGVLWLGFHEMKDKSGAAPMWDTYGAFLWGLALVYATVRSRRGRLDDIFSVIFSVAFLAGLYGILQYWGRDMIWGSPIQPYGGRPVSTFGNPNFLSSHLMMVSPLAFAHGLNKLSKDRWGYFLIALVSAMGVLCTLTRSTYVGLFVSYAIFLLLTFRFRRILSWKTTLIVLGGFLAVIFIFPHTPLSKVQSPLARFTEILDAYRTGAPYGPWDQRILIWSCAWDMVKSNLLLGKGWGCFELFYPFYQGHFILIERMASFRTHANNAHNVLLEMWSQTGFLGVGTSLWLVATILTGGWFLFRREADEAKKNILAAMLAALVGMFFDNFFGNVSIFFAVPAFLFWWIVGSLFVSSFPIASVSRTIRGWQQKVVIGMLVFTAGGSAVYYLQRWQQEVQYFLGFKLAKSNLMVPSIKSLENAVAWFSKEVNTNYELGNSYSRYAHELKGKGLKDEAKTYNEKAVVAYREALAANPGYDEIYFNLGVCLSMLGRQEESQKALEMCLYINPLFRDGYNSLGNYYLNNGQFEKAIALFERGTSLFPKDKDLWNNLGYSYSQLKQEEKSFYAYKKAVMADPNFQQGWHNLGIAAQASKRRDPILEVPTLIQKMEGALRVKDYNGALKPTERIVEILPDNADAHLSLGNIYFYLGRFDQTEKQYNRAIELNSNFVVAMMNLGKMYQSQKKWSQARAQFEKALSVDPNNNEAKQAISSLPKN